MSNRVENVKVLQRAEKFTKVMHTEIMRTCGYFHSNKDINSMFDIVIKNLGREYTRVEHYSRTSLKAIYIATKKMKEAKEKFNDSI